MEHILCARQCFGTWEYKNKTDKLAPGHMELLLNGKSDNKSN